jgi:hypothetical protein
MRTDESPVAFVARQMQRSRLHRGAENCTNIYVATARWRWPEKTAENWAAAAGRKPRIAKAWLKGDVSPAGKLAIIRLFD